MRNERSVGCVFVLRDAFDDRKTLYTKRRSDDAACREYVGMEGDTSAISCAMADVEFDTSCSAAGTVRSPKMDRDAPMIGERSLWPSSGPSRMRTYFHQLNIVQDQRYTR